MARRGTMAYTPELAEEVIAGIAAGLTDQDACAAAGISVDTLARWKSGKSGAPAEVADRIARARPRRTRRWLGKLWQLAESGNVAAIDSLLDRCAPDYRKVDRKELTGKDGAPFPAIVLVGVDPEAI